MDFYEVKTKYVSKDKDEVIADFKVGPSNDLMVQGKSFYAVWNPDTGLWSKNEFDVVRIVDESINDYIEENRQHSNKYLEPKFLSSYSSSSWTKYKKFIKEMPDCYKQLDTKIIFANSKVKKTDYASRRLPYVMEEGSIAAYNELMTILYESEEREIIEWAIGAIISGDSRKIQKFIGLYGDPGTGKSTILNIIETLFDGYCVAFNAKELVSNNNAFAGDAFATNPLVGVQHDGDLSKIVDNSLLNTIVSHEKVIINEKFKSKFEVKLNTFLFIASNEPFMITNQNSGMKRRLIDVLPTGNRVEKNHYNELMDQIYKEELGHIAYHCLEVYKRLGKHAYDEREPRDMMRKTDPFYNFVMDNIALSPDIIKTDSISVKQAFTVYKRAYDNGEVLFKYPMYKVREGLIPYFKEFVDKQHRNDIGERVGPTFYGLKSYLFEHTRKQPSLDKALPIADNDWLKLKPQKSKLDKAMADMPAQYALLLGDGRLIPKSKWEKVKTTLKDLDTSKCHYINCPIKYICIDFDIKDENGNKSKELNLKAAESFPPTYAEYSQGGEGLHLHYIYLGDAALLDSKYDEDIEIKVYTGDGAVRRRLTECNNLNIAFMDQGFLPLKENKKKVIKDGIVKNETTLRLLVENNLNKEYHDNTTQSIHFIHQLLDEAYNDGYYYDLSDLEQAVFQFASKSSHQAEHCLDLFDQMHFKSKNADILTTQDVGIPVGNDKPIVFFDIEVFPNLFVLCYTFEEGDVIVMENPGFEELEYLFNNYRLVGFNNKDYDNIVVYKRWKMKLDNLHTYYISRDIVQNGNKAGKTAAKFISYTDIYDYLPTMKRQSLKEFEIDLGIHHEELGLPWDKPVDEKLWSQVEKYCSYDVEATRTLWFATQPEFKAREILAELTGMTVNDSTNELSQQLIFGDEKNPQIDFNYRFMGECEPGHTCRMEDDGVTCIQDDGKIIFPGYKFDGYNSSYLDVDKVGEGGYIYYEPGMYDDVWTFDVSGQHPASIIAEKLFGDEYTAVFADIVKLRTLIKHKDFESAKKMFDGKVAKYLDNPDDAKALSNALKVVVNSVYGMTFSTHNFRCRDDRNIDNIVAKRGSLFMINLRYLVQKMGYTVLHCKTDSIKVQHPDKKVYDFIMEYGKKFGYNFEIEHKFEKICLVNKAVYIAKVTEDDPEWLDACEKAKKDNKPVPTRWTATGTQFAVPYVFKSLFSKEPIEFKDFCEKKKVQGVIYKDMNEELEDVSLYERVKKTRDKIDRDVKVTNKARIEAEEYSYLSEEELDAEIAKGHNYMFVGKVGNFVPIKPGCNGGILYRYDDKKDMYAAVTGTDGYRWEEAEIIQKTNRQQDIDESYHQNLADKAAEAINTYGDFEWFVS